MGAEEYYFYLEISAASMVGNGSTDIFCVGSESEIDIFESVDRIRHEEEMVCKLPFICWLCIRLGYIIRLEMIDCCWSFGLT